jgi:hypothetical protein
LPAGWRGGGTKHCTDAVLFSCGNSPWHAIRRKTVHSLQAVPSCLLYAMRVRWVRMVPEAPLRVHWLSAVPDRRQEGRGLLSYGIRWKSPARSCRRSPAIRHSIPQASVRGLSCCHRYENQGLASCLSIVANVSKKLLTAPMDRSASSGIWSGNGLHSPPPYTSDCEWSPRSATLVRLPRIYGTV